MKAIPYASVIGSIKYAMLCTRPIVYLVMSLARGYNSNPGVDHLTAVKIYPQLPKRTKEIFLGYGGDKQFVVKGYVDASFGTDPDALQKRHIRDILGRTEIFSVMLMTLL